MGFSEHFKAVYGIPSTTTTNNDNNDDMDYLYHDENGNEVVELLPHITVHVSKWPRYVIKCLELGIHDKEFAQACYEENKTIEQAFDLFYGTPDEVPVLPKAECKICMDDYLVEEMYTLNCDHRFCFHCLQRFCETEARSKKFEIICPLEDCSEAITPAQIECYLQHNMELYNEWSEFIVVHNPANVRCTFCNNPISVTEEERIAQPFLQCPYPTCRKEFCVNGCAEPHRGYSCEEYRDKLHLNDEYLRGLKKTKCPKCKEIFEDKKVQDNETCDKITCTKNSCGARFCYRCFADYDKYSRDASYHFEGCTWWQPPPDDPDYEDDPELGERPGKLTEEGMRRIERIVLGEKEEEEAKAAC